MKDLRNNKKKIIILILIFIIILCVLFKMAQSKNLSFQEDLIFFKLFSIGNVQRNSEEEKYNQENSYEIKVIKGKSNNKKIDLLQTIDIKTLVNQKIAPGTKGSFYVYLISNSNMDYEMEILDKNNSPKNFKFEISPQNGNIEKNKIKKVRVSWEWPYEISEEENIQDTVDGENIKEYNFEICTIGK